MGFFIIVVTTMLVVASKLGSWGEKSFYLQNRLMLVFKYEWEREASWNFISLNLR